MTENICPACGSNNIQIRNGHYWCNVCGDYGIVSEES